MSGDVILAARGLRYSFGAGTDARGAAVDGVDLDLVAGTITGFLGQNGAGKSTTMRLLAGELIPSAGTITVGGASIAKAAARRAVGWAPETPPLHPAMTVLEHLRLADDLAADAAGERAHILGGAERCSVERAIEALDLGPVRRRLCNALSKGNRQRVAVAAAILGAPSVLLLDEPSSGLDPEQRRRLMALVRQRRDSGVAILVSSHLTGELAEMCDDVVAIANGRTVFRGPSSEMARAVAAAVNGGDSDVDADLSSSAPPREVVSAP